MFWIQSKSILKRSTLILLFFLRWMRYLSACTLGSKVWKIEKKKKAKIKRCKKYCIVEFAAGIYWTVGSWWISGPLEHGGRGERRRIQLVKINRRPDKPEKYPSSNHDKNGGVSKLVEPEKHTLLSHVEFHCLLTEAHVIPLLNRRRTSRSLHL